MTTIVESDAAVVAERTSRLSWGAVLAGLVFVIAMSWLLFLFGSAVGLGIADATDMEAIGDGLGMGAVIWMLISSIVTFFLGSVLAARLSGRSNETTGMMHGVTLWSVGTALMIVLGYFGMSGLLQTGQAMVKGMVSTTAAIGTATVTGASAVGAAAEDLANSPLATSIQVQLKRQASELLSQSEATSGAPVSQQEAQQALEQIDAQTLQNVATALAQGNTEEAKRVLANGTGLAPPQIDSLMEGISNDVQQFLPPQGEIATDEALNSIQESIMTQASQFIASLSSSTEAPTHGQDIEQALEQIDVDTLQSAAIAFIQGDTDTARNILAVNTNLSEAQINGLVDGVGEEVNQQIETYKQEISEAAETATDYAQAVLWTVFISAALGLAVSIAGGLIGATTVGRVYRITS